MGLRFHRSFQLFPGVRLNLSKSGLSAGFGVPGAMFNVGPRGTRSTVGIPGTGISYVKYGSLGERSPGRETPRGHSEEVPGQEFTPTEPGYYQPQTLEMRQINSASLEELTSPSLVELRDMIATARTQRHEIENGLNEAQQLHDSKSQELAKKQRSILRYFYKNRIAELEASIPEAAANLKGLQGWFDSTRINMQFDTSASAKRAYGALVRVFEKLRTSAASWDITADRFGNRVVERSFASRSITRTRVQLDYAATDLIHFDGQAMKFDNANGECILIYPGMIIMPREDGAFALIDLRNIRLETSALQFVEVDPPPADAEVVGYTWAKVNKDGSPDMRFRDNYQIPLCRYGCVTFASSGGIQEEYQFSNADAALEFGEAFLAYQAALAK